MDIDIDIGMGAWTYGNYWTGLARNTRHVISKATGRDRARISTKRIRHGNANKDITVCINICLRSKGTGQEYTQGTAQDAHQAMAGKGQARMAASASGSGHGYRTWDIWGMSATGVTGSSS